MDFNSQNYLLSVMELFPKKNTQETTRKVGKIAEQLLDCLRGELPKSVRQEIKIRGKMERHFHKMKKARGR